MRFSRIVAWLGSLVAVGLYGWSVPLVLATTSPTTFAPATLTWPAPFVAMALVGALVVARRPENATGWLLLGAGAIMTLNAWAQAYANFAIANDASLPLAHVVAWLAFWTWAPAALAIGAALMVFPSGTPAASVWRWLIRLGLALAALLVIAALETFGGTTRAFVEDGAIPHGGFFQALGGLPVPTFMLLGLAALVYRFVRARGAERLQMKWLVLGTSILAVAIPVDVVAGRNNDAVSSLVTVGIMAIPVSAGIGILRYRLWDIDRVISRTFSYGLVTATLGGIFALIALVPTAIVGSGHAPSAAIATATLAVAAAFGPVRRRAQRVVDSRFNRARYDAVRTIDAFTARLRDEIDLDALRDEIARVVDHTMRPSHVSVWIRDAT